MNEDENKPIYPAAPLEQNIAMTNEQKQHLLAKPQEPPPAPPTYDQAIGTDPTVTTQPRSTPAATSGPGDPHVVVVTQPANTYGPNPVDVQCPFCHNYSRTRIRSKPTSRTHLIALLLCLFQLYCCICVPYCIGSCMNTNHYCGMCDQYLGTYHR